MHRPLGLRMRSPTVGRMRPTELIMLLSRLFLVDERHKPDCFKLDPPQALSFSAAQHEVLARGADGRHQSSALS